MASFWICFVFFLHEINLDIVEKRKTYSAERLPPPDWTVHMSVGHWIDC